MKKIVRAPFLWPIIFLLLIVVPTSALDTLHLTLPSFSDNSHLYYHELLEKSLKQIGYEVLIQTPFKHIPQKRSHLMLQTGDLSLMWLIESEERNRKYIPVSVGLTNKLIGKRVLFIPKGKQNLYDSVKSLDDFIVLNKVGAFGIDWYDEQVWHANKLRCIIIDGEWRQIYRLLLLEKKGIDYFSRGLTEIVSEAKLYPDLAIEQKLVFIYDRDFVFYLSKNAETYKPILKEALEKAKANGLIDSLISKYWGDDFTRLNYNNRIKIHLALPDSTKQ